MLLRVIVASAVMVTAVPAAAARAPQAGTVAPVASTVTVDRAGPGRPFNNPVRYQNQISPLPPRNLASVTAVGPSITRVWLSPDAKLAAGGWAAKYPVFDQVAEHSGRIMVVLLPCHGLFTTPDPTECLTRTEEGLRHFKERYPTLEYVEFYNELDMTPVAPDYYRWYRRGYEMVNRVNAGLTPGIPLRIGGPSASTFAYCETHDRGFLKDFLLAYARDTAPGKRLDFLSYHSYNLAQKERDACGEPVIPPDAAQEKRMLSDLLGRLGLPRDTPVHVTETGLFAGDKTGTADDGSPNPPARPVTRS